MDWMKKHVDTVIILTAFGTSLLWMNSKFNDVDKQFSEIHQELAVMFWSLNDSEMEAVGILYKLHPE